MSKLASFTRMTAEERMDRLRADLLTQSDPASKRLIEKMNRCAKDWKDQRYRCRIPACARCRWRNIKRQRHQAHDIFGHHSHEHLAFVSVVTDATTDVDGLGTINTSSRTDLRNRVKACRKRSTRWDGVYLSASHEIDAVAPEQIPLLPTERRAMVEQLAPHSLMKGEPVWLGSFHGIMHTNGLDAQEIALELRRQWPVPGQVDVRQFYGWRPVPVSIDRIIWYGNKFSPTTHLNDQYVELWPASWESSVLRWLGSYRNAFEALRFSVGPKGESPFYQRLNNCNDQEHDVDEDDDCDAMPWLITTVPMSIDTGGWW